MRNILFTLVLYVLVLAAIFLTVMPGTAFIYALWIIFLLLGSAFFLSLLLPFWFKGGIKHNLRRSLRITIPAAAILFLVVYSLFCLSVWI